MYVSGFRQDGPRVAEVSGAARQAAPNDRLEDRTSSRVLGKRIF